MTSYREILRLAASGYSKSSIAKSVPYSRNTVTSVLDRAKELGLEWPLAPDLSDPELGKNVLSEQRIRCQRQEDAGCGICPEGTSQERRFQEAALDGVS